MDNWTILLLHTRRETLLKRVFERAFPEKVISLHVPALGERHYWTKRDLVDYFRRNVYDPGIWKGRVLTVYGDGEFHHYTYALTRLAANRRGLHSWDWTYFHLDNHRDDWSKRSRGNGEPSSLNCASFVDSIAHDHRAIPFMVGPVVYARKDSLGYLFHGQRIPIYNNQFPMHQQLSKYWGDGDSLWGKTDQRSLPDIGDLLETPREAYLSFDLDLLANSEIVTNFDQGYVTLRRLCEIVELIRAYKRIFSADILGFPDKCHHGLSVLTVLILARKVLGLGVDKLLDYHDQAKRTQQVMYRGQPEQLRVITRRSPIHEEDLIERLA